MQTTLRPRDVDDATLRVINSPNLQLRRTTTLSQRHRAHAREHTRNLHTRTRAVAPRAPPHDAFFVVPTPTTPNASFSRSRAAPTPKYAATAATSAAHRLTNVRYLRSGHAMDDRGGRGAGAARGAQCGPECTSWQLLCDVWYARVET